MWNFEDPTGNTAEIAFPISGFRGDGNSLHSYEVHLYQFNGGIADWSNVDFTLRFWNTQASMMSDPLLETPGALDRRLVFDVPDNVDWNTPISVVGPPSNQFYLYRAIFDLRPFNIETSPGALHFMQAGPTGPLHPLGPHMIATPAAVGGLGDVGTEPAWYWGLGDPQPYPLPAGALTYPYQSDRILTVPEPATMVLTTLGIGFFRRRRA